MAPGSSDIKMHVDSGGYAKLGHRIHVPIVTNRNVAFDLCPYQLQGRQLPNGGSGLPVGDPVALAAAAAVKVAGHQSAQRQQQQQQQTAAKHLPPDEAKCVRIPAPEGLAFELNNRSVNIFSIAPLALQQHYAGKCGQILQEKLIISSLHELGTN